MAVKPPRTGWQRRSVAPFDKLFTNGMQITGGILEMIGNRAAGKKHLVHWEANQRPTREVGLLCHFFIFFATQSTQESMLSVSCCG